MVDHASRNLFEIGEDAWKHYIASRTEHRWIESNHLPGFDNVAKYVETAENLMIRTVNQKPHYFLALLVAQNKKTVYQTDLLRICQCVYLQDIRESETLKKRAGKVQDKDFDANYGGRKNIVKSSPVQQPILPQLHTILNDGVYGRSPLANDRQYFVFCKQGPIGIGNNQSKTNAADQLLHMRQTQHSNARESLS